MTLGDMIKEYRAAQGVSQDVIAERAGLSKAYISILERNFNPSTGEPPIPSYKTMKAIAWAIDRAFDQVFDSLEPELRAALAQELPPQGFHPDLPANVLPLPRTKKVPLIGTIACGQPILAVEETTELVDVPSGISADFALRCQGDSMIGARIHDGDLVYIRKQPTVPNGAIAAVRIGDEATLKRVFVKESSIILQPHNPMYEPLIYSKHEMDEVEILGRAVAFLSKLEH